MANYFTKSYFRKNHRGNPFFPNPYNPQTKPETDIERMFRMELERQGLRHGIDFFSQKKVGKYYPDFYFPAFRAVVECDGNRYHGNSGDIFRDRMAIKRDAKKDDFYKSSGIRVYRFSGSRIKSNVHACVREFLVSIQ